jgi:hypothetical protein
MEGDNEMKVIEELEKLVEELLQRIENGHPQSIGAIHNVRMVQYGIEEVPRYRASLHALLPRLRTEERDKLRAAFADGCHWAMVIMSDRTDKHLHDIETEAERRWP